MSKRVMRRVGREILVFVLALIAAVGLIAWETHGFQDRPSWWQIAAHTERLTD